MNLKECVDYFHKDKPNEQPKPLIWNDAINAMSAEEKARFWVGKGTEIHNQACHYAYASETKKKSWDECYVEKMTEFFNSPYDGGKQEGAE